MVTMNDTELTVKEQCELLSINRSTLYYKPKEPQETAIEREEYSKSRIDYWHTKFCVFGHRRIREKLRREDGIQIGRKLPDSTASLKSLILTRAVSLPAKIIKAG